MARKTYEAIRDRPRPPMPPKDLGPDDWQEPMYFKTPGQLLEVFTQLEEQNLFLIQNAQETEEQLEELRLKFKETKERMDAETESLQEQIAALEVGIAAQRERVKALEGKAQISGVAEQGAGSITLDDLHKKASESEMGEGCAARGCEAANAEACAVQCVCCEVAADACGRGELRWDGRCTVAHPCWPPGPFC